MVMDDDWAPKFGLLALSVSSASSLGPRLSLLPLGSLSDVIEAAPGEGARTGSVSSTCTIGLRRVSDVLRLTVFLTPSQPNTPPAFTVTSSSVTSWLGSGVTGRLFGFDSIKGDLFNTPERLLALFTRPFFSISRSEFSAGLSCDISGSAKTIRGVGLLPREGKGEETDCAFDGTGGAASPSVAW